jgi:hypothetical protein
MRRAARARADGQRGQSPRGLKAARCAKSREGPPPRMTDTKQKARGGAKRPERRAAYRLFPRRESGGESGAGAPEGARKRAEWRRGPDPRPCEVWWYSFYLIIGHY